MNLVGRRLGRWRGAGSLPTSHQRPAARREVVWSLRGIHHCHSSTGAAHITPQHTHRPLPPGSYSIGPYWQAGISPKLRCWTSSTESMEWKRDVELQLRGDTSLCSMGTGHYWLGGAGRAGVTDHGTRDINPAD